jgi:hypothetical protein
MDLGWGGLMNVAVRRRVGRLLLVVLIGLVLGALITELAVRFMPESAAREFFTTSVAAAFGPLVMDLVAVGLTLGPLVFHLNALSVVGVLVVALGARAWLWPGSRERSGRVPGGTRGNGPGPSIIQIEGPGLRSLPLRRSG